MKPQSLKSVRVSIGTQTESTDYNYPVEFTQNGVFNKRMQNTTADSCFPPLDLSITTSTASKPLFIWNPTDSYYSPTTIDANPLNLHPLDLSMRSPSYTSVTTKPLPSRNPPDFNSPVHPFPYDLSMSFPWSSFSTPNPLAFQPPVMNSSCPPPSIISAKNKALKIVKCSKRNNKKMDVKKEKFSFQPFERDGDVILGPNETFIEKTKLEALNWRKSKFAIRGILRLLFPREVLSSHSLTGKPSPGNLVNQIDK